MTLIDVKNINKSFRVKGQRKPIKVLDDVSLRLHEGEFVALIGESGSGKTTLAKIILGLITPDAGKINRAESGNTRLCQLILQNPYAAFDPLLSMERSLTEPLLANQLAFNREEARHQVHEALLRFGLETEDLTKKGIEFSGGQLQRFGILRAMLLKPKVLIADEILSALDSQRKHSILDLLLKLKTEEGLAILFITHDLRSIRNYAETMYVMHNGKVVEHGPAKQLLTAPEHSYTQRLLSAVPKL